MAEKLRQYLLVALLSVAFAAIGCGAAPSTNPDDYVGGYAFTPHDANRGQFADFVILGRSGKALEIRLSKTNEQVLFTDQSWHLEPGWHQEDIVIAKRGYPIERSGTTIKLGINDDLDEYYEKVR
ncbi:MAG: hypothetical protein ACHQJX_10360 [Candidatus Acidiferrales bacterium]